MIKTITLNPAVDKTIRIDGFSINTVNRVQSVREDPGGKGINVSKMIQILGGKSIALGVVGGSTGAFIKNRLSEGKIVHDFVEVEKNTRTNTKIVDTVNQTYTDVNEPGGELSEWNLKVLEEKIFYSSKKGDILVFSGSVPKNINSSIYGDWIGIAKEMGIQSILDADGELLLKGIQKGPYLVKPNIHELERLKGGKFDSLRDSIDFARTLFQYGIRIIVISLGEQGSILLTQEKVIKVQGIIVEAKSTVGAGDSMVGALAFGLDQGLSLEEMISLAGASSAASVMNEGTIMGNMEQIETLLKQVKLEHIEG